MVFESLAFGWGRLQIRHGGLMRKLINACAVIGVIMLLPKSETKLSAYTEFVSTPIPQQDHAGQNQRMEYGLASWYGEEYQGRPTANGELYDMHRLTAAHRSLPMGTTIKVTNTTNHRAILLRVNDRGPSNSGRLLDVSWEAAKQLGFLKVGLAPVQVEVVTYSGYRNPK
jgi:rare lipoprotein A (peptidoglycan hydrolase)